MLQSKLKEFCYENREYLNMLQTVDNIFYEKYISFVKHYLSSKNKSFIDIGCGNGNVLYPLKMDGYKNIYGCEISKLFTESALERGLKNIFLYDGIKIPFDSNYFDVVGSFGVIEHASDPINLLNEHIRIAKKNGVIIVTCPNFLSVLYRLDHPRTDTFLKRLKNIPRILGKLFSNEVCFEKVNPIIRKKFRPDDDMVTVANLIDLERFFKKNRCRIVYSNGFMSRNNFMLRLLGSTPVLKYFLPSCFIVAVKEDFGF